MSGAIKIENVDFSYKVPRRRQILHNVSLSIPEGQVVAIMGGSGSGKTTLLRNIAGLVIPDSGKIVVNEKNIPDLNEKALYELRRDIGMLFQFGGLFTDLSVFDNVAFPLREHTDLSEAIINDLVLLKLQAVGLRAAASKFPSELSGGMARRVALARTIAMDPKILLYDEPFAGLDPVSLAVIAQLIRRLSDSLGATSVIVTHDVEESFMIVDYVYIMWNGQIISEGTPSEMRKSPEPLVKQFINGETDGPLPFHMPGTSLEKDLRIGEHQSE